MRSVLAALILFAALIPKISFAEAVLYVSPERGTYTVGENFDMKIYADTGGALVNAAEAEISFHNESLEVVALSTEGSILDSWSAEPDFSNDEGTIHFAGWTKKNYSGVTGLLLTVKFKALKNAVGSARLAAGAILAADGRESNIITSMRSGIFTIKPAEAPEPAAEESATTTFIKAKVPAPAFDDYPDTVEVGERIVIRGNAEPNARILVWLSRGSESEVQSELLSASDGTFTYVSEEKAAAGVYHVRATVETEDGRTSVLSETLDITASPKGVAASAMFGASLLFEVLPFFALLVIGGLGVAYVYHRHQLAKMHYGRHSMFDTD